MPQIALWATLRCLLPPNVTKTKSVSRQPKKGLEKKPNEKQSERDKDSVLATTNVSPYQRGIIKSVATRLPAAARIARFT